MGWTTNFSGWVEQDVGVKFRGDSPRAQTLANVNADYPKNNGVNRIIRTLPAYFGYDHISVSSIAMGAEIYTSAVTGVFPFALYASAKNVTCVGNRTLTSEPIHPYEHLEHRWTISKSDGSACEYGDEIIDPNSNNVINPYTDQVGGESSFVLREDGEYTLQLTSIAPGGITNYIRKTITVSVPTYQHAWYDGLNGNDANDGFDPWGFTCTNATYTEATGALTEIGKFATYDHNAATADVSTNNFNWIYLGATYKWRRIASKTNNDTIVLLDKLGSDQTGLTSSTGAKQTFTGSGASDTFTHLRGNAGATTYTILTETSFNIGSGATTDVRAGGYDGKSNLIADAGFSGTIFNNFTNASGGLPVVSSLHNMALDGNAVAKTIDGISGSTSDVKVSYLLLDNVSSTRSSAETGINVQSNAATKPMSWFLWNANIDNHKVAAEATRQGIYTFLVGVGHTAFVGGSITGEGDSNTLDHYWYPNIYNDHLCARYILFTGGINYNQCINLNTAIGKEVNYITEADCYGDGDVNWMTDASGSNNDPTETSIKNFYIARNAVDTNQAFMFHFNGKQYTALDNILLSGDRTAFNQAYNTDPGYIPADFSYVLSRNFTYGFGLDSNADNPSGAREVVDNICHITATAKLGLIVASGGFDADVSYTANNFYAPNDVDSKTISDNAVDITLAAFDTATGFTNTSIDPSWNDPANGDFS